MNAMPTAAAAGKIEVGADRRVNRPGFGAMRISGSGIWDLGRSARSIRAITRAALSR
jgi:hypothetical protein